jgi:hypothetical protein
MKVKFMLLMIIATTVLGCAYLGDKIYEKASSPANIRLETIDENNGIVKYDWGAFVEPNGDQLANNAMNNFCQDRKVEIISSDERVIGEKKFEQKINFKCLN